jgi:hypothetical protein
MGEQIMKKAGAATRRLRPTWCENPAVAIPEKRGMLVVVRHRVASRYKPSSICTVSGDTPIGL